jgi:hypothetical protein
VTPADATVQIGGVWMTPLQASAFESYESLGPSRTLDQLYALDRLPDGTHRWERALLSAWAESLQWDRLCGQRQQELSEASRQATIEERKKLAKLRLSRAADFQTYGMTILSKANLHKLSVKESRWLLGHAVRLVELGMKYERLELGESTESIATLRPPKPLDQMSLDELRAWRAKLEEAAKL